MKQAQSNICVDDCVRDNGGVQGPDFGGDIGGWQDRISSIDPRVVSEHKWDNSEVGPDGPQS
jgi:hypothetical protein